MDIMLPAQRQKAMTSNRGRTRVERKVASALWRAGFRFVTSEGYLRQTGLRLAGKPDVIFSRKRIVVFVDGCFWHGCKRCHDFDRDLNAWWRTKIATNVARDRRVRAKLRRIGWKVLVVREHNLSTQLSFERTLRQLMSRIADVR